MSRRHACDAKIGQRINALFWDPTKKGGRKRASGTVVAKDFQLCLLLVTLDGGEEASLPFEQGVTLGDES